MRPLFIRREEAPDIVSAHRRSAMLAIGGFAFATTLGYLRLPPASAAPIPPAADALAQFMTLSTWLTGRPSLNVELGRRYLETLAGQATDFAAQLVTLNSLRPAHGGPGPQAYCDAVEASGAAHAGLPRRILAAWYTGQVGKLPAASQHHRSAPPQPDAGATVVAYEMALMYAPTADVLTIPSYCRDVPGYWARQPQGSAA